MKWIKRLVILFVILLVVIVGLVYLALDGLVKSLVESQGTSQLHVPVTLDSVSLGLIHGSVGMNNFAIGSPPGFSAPQMMSVGKLSVDSGGISNLRGNPIHINSIVIDAPKLVIEQKGLKVNFKEMIDQLPKSTTPADKTEPQPTKTQAVKLVIDTLTITNASVAVESDLPGVKPMDITLPTMDMKNVGNADGNNSGAAIKDVAISVITKMVDQATKSGKLPGGLSSLLTGDLSGGVTGAAQNELNKLKVPVNVGGLLNQLGGKK